MKSLLAFKNTDQQWHLPLIAGLSVGIPMLLGWLLDNMEGGKLGSLAGLSILYIQSYKLSTRMILLMTCCFGIMISYTVGLLFSFNAMVAPFALGILSFGIHYSLHKLRFTKPPGNFFFIMIASIAICTPFNYESIPEKIGYVAMGTILTCGLGLVYSLLTLNPTTESTGRIPQKKSTASIVESATFALFMGISLAVAFFLELDNPYWIPISCLAVMQGISTKHVWLRALQRILGTFIGLGITWLLFASNPSPLFIVIGFILLQIIIEFLVVRNYTLAVIFITILTIILAESGGELSMDINEVFMARMVDITLGSLIVL